jgi:hypothetical protein
MSVWEKRLGAKNEAYYEGYNPHPSHCCVYHGCKYGYDDCPVSMKEEKQEYPCEDCGHERDYFFSINDADKAERLYNLMARYLLEETAINSDDSIVSIKRQGDLLKVWALDNSGQMHGMISVSSIVFDKWARENWDFGI